MTSALIQTRRRQYYGKYRDINLEAQQMAGVLKKDHVLQKGEYNFDADKQQQSKSWQSSTKAEYRGQRPARVGRLYSDTHLQLRGTLQFGNDSGKLVPDYTYKVSTQNEDYVPKEQQKKEYYGEERIVNWPDMAPQYQTNRSVGQSEYDNTFKNDQMLNPTAPSFPKIDTSKLQLPIQIKPETLPLRGVHVDLGSDPRNIESEAQYAFGTSKGRRRPGSSGLGSKLEDAQEINKMMKNMERRSHVFRGGDYNGITQSLASTFTVDYDKKEHVPISNRFPMAGLVRPGGTAEEGDEEEDVEDSIKKKIPNVIKYTMKDLEGEVTRNNRVPSNMVNYLNHIPKNSAEGKGYHTGVHFEFGTDKEKLQSVYDKDFMPGTKDKREKPEIITRPKDSEIYHHDPNLWFGTSNKQDYVQHTPHAATMANADRNHQMKQNMERRHGNNVHLSYDPSWSTSHRQTSLHADDYQPAPANFKALDLAKGPEAPYNFLETEGVFSYPANKNKRTERQDNFKTMFMDPEFSKARRRWKDEQTKGRLEDGRVAHFILGSDPQEHATENRVEFSGRKKEDEEVPAAGKIENIPDADFNYFRHSDNQRDLKPDPHWTSKHESLVARNLHVTRSLPSLPLHKSSVMNSDYRPLHERRFTSAQETMLVQSDKMNNKPIEKSHFFHMDTSARNNFETTNMADFIKPEEMSGKVHLAAR